MKIKLLQSLAGNDITYNVGDVIEVKPVTAQRFIAEGVAVAVETTKPLRKAVVKGSRKRKK